jgi:dihydrofolate reductase
VGPTQHYTATTLDGFIADPDNSLDWPLFQDGAVIVLCFTS